MCLHFNCSRNASERSVAETCVELTAAKKEDCHFVVLNALTG